MTKIPIFNGIATLVSFIRIMNYVNTLRPDEFRDFVEKEKYKEKKKKLLKENSSR